MTGPWRRVAALACVTVLAAPSAWAQVPVEATATPPASGWAMPSVGETVTVRVAVGTAAAPSAVRFVGFKFFYDPAAYTFVSRTVGPLLDGVDLDDSDGTSDGLLLVRNDTDVYGSGRNAVSFSVALFDGAPLISADGRAAVEIVLRIRAAVAAERFTVIPGEVELRNGGGALVASSASVVRAQAVTGGVGVDPPSLVFPEVGGIVVDFAALSTSSVLNVRRSEAAPGGTAIPTGFMLAGAGSWTLGLSAPAAFSADVCIPFSYVDPPGTPPASVRIQTRASPSVPWTILPTRILPSTAAPAQACATVTSFSEFVLTAQSDGLPVELTAFDALRDGVGVVLHWQTASETANAGFGVEQQDERGSAEQWREIAFVAGRGTTAEAHAYTHRVAALSPGTHRFRLRQVDLDGTARLSATVEAVVDAPDALWLASPAPSPAATSTTVRYALAAAADVRLVAYDLQGRRVATLDAGPRVAGSHDVPVDVSAFPPGLYLVRLTTATMSRTVTLTVRR